MTQQTKRNYLAAQKIAAAINTLRPTWELKPLTQWILNHADHIGDQLLAAALAWAALDPDVEYPNVITNDPAAWMAGHHAIAEKSTHATTPATASVNGQPAQQYARHGSSGRMPCHPHGYPDHQTCPECAQDRAKARARRERGPQPGQNWRNLAAKHGWHPEMKDKPHKHIQKPTEPAPESTQTTNPTPTHPP